MWFNGLNALKFPVHFKTVCTEVHHNLSLFLMINQLKQIKVGIYIRLKTSCDLMTCAGLWQTLWDEIWSMAWDAFASSAHEIKCVSGLSMLQCYKQLLSYDVVTGKSVMERAWSVWPVQSRTSPYFNRRGRTGQNNGMISLMEMLSVERNF